MPTLKGLKVVRSPIHGYGIIALRAFKAGDTLVCGDGVLYDEDDDFDDTYCLVYSDDEDQGEDADRYLDLIDQTRWINHACSPNCEVVTDRDPKSGEPCAWWTALRDIKAGDELTYDYCFAGHLAEPCNCDSSACIGLIVDPDDLAEVPRKLRSLIKKERLSARRSQIQLADL